MGKTFLIIGIVLVVIGLVLTVIGFATNGFDISALDKNKYSERSETVTEPFTSIRIDTDTIDVKLLKSGDGTCKIDWFEKKNQTNTAVVSDGTLQIRSEEKFTFSLFSFKKTTVSIYLPDEEYERLSVEADTSDLYLSKELKLGAVNIELDTGDVLLYSSVDTLKLETDTGDVLLSEISATKIDISTETGDLKLSGVTASETKIEVDTGDVRIESSTLGAFIHDADTGDLEMKGVRCESATLSYDTGDVTMRDTLINGELKITGRTGDTSMYSSDAGSISIRLTTGDVYGELLTPKSFNVHSNTGKERVPAGTTGGVCAVECSTGDITFKIVDAE